MAGIQGEIRITAALQNPDETFEEIVPVEIPARNVLAPLMEQLSTAMLSGGGLKKVLGAGHVELIPWSRVKTSVSIKFEEKYIQVVQP